VNACEGWKMSLPFDLVSFLGSPFEGSPSQRIGASKEDIIKMYEIAFKNKVGLFFLDKLKDAEKLPPELEGQYRLGLDRHLETMQTAVSLTSSLSATTRDFAIFKFLKPFPHTPSDVDALIFPSQGEYTKIVNHLLDHGYFKIGACPSQTVVYDLRGGYEGMDKRTVGGKEGGKYYIDLYNNVSASHVIYVNKETLADQIITVNPGKGSIQTLSPVADLVVILAHSIIPEELFTLNDYYTTLYYLDLMSKSDLDRLYNLFAQNCILKCGKLSLSLVGKIHQQVHGFIPDKLDYILQNFYVNETELLNINIKSLPYRYSISALLWVLAERMKERKGLQSIATQAVCTANPRMAKWVIYNLIFRRMRETY